MLLKNLVEVLAGYDALMISLETDNGYAEHFTQGMRNPNKSS